jgi:hypothetical protein
LPAKRDSHCNHQYELHEKFIHGEQCTTAAQRVGWTFLSAPVDLRCMWRGRPRREPQSVDANVHVRVTTNLYNHRKQVHGAPGSRLFLDANLGLRELRDR